jgi:hypothetical protein
MLGAFAARADGPTRPLAEALHVHPGATCVDTETLAEQVGTWLASDRVDAGVSVDVEGSADDPRAVAFTMTRGAGVVARRRFDPGPERCENLQASLGLAIALAIKVSLLDDLAGFRVAAPAPAAPARLLDLSAGATLAVGVLPGVEGGLTAHLARAIGAVFAVRVGILALAGWGKTLDNVGGSFEAGSFDAELLALQIDACVRVDLLPRLHLRACTGFAGGALFAQGGDVPGSRGAASGWGAVTDSLGLVADLGDRWSAEAEITMLVPFDRTRVGVRSAAGDEVDSRELGAFGGAVSLGPVLRF